MQCSSLKLFNVYLIESRVAIQVSKFLSSDDTGTLSFYRVSIPLWYYVREFP